MSSTHPYQPPNAVYRPSRGDQRIVRAILADLVDGQACEKLDRIANGPASLVAGFLASCRHLAFIFVANSRGGSALANCGPDVDSAIDVARRALDLPPPGTLPSAPGSVCGPAEVDGRACVIRSALEHVMLGLDDRDQCLFVAAFCVDGDPDVDFYYSHRLGHETAHNWISWFLVEKLHVATPSAPSNTAYAAGSR